MKVTVEDFTNDEQWAVVIASFARGGAALPRRELTRMEWLPPDRWISREEAAALVAMGKQHEH
jgi:hypothetical protein